LDLEQCPFICSRGNATRVMLPACGIALNPSFSAMAVRTRYVHITYSCPPKTRRGCLMESLQACGRVLIPASHHSDIWMCCSRGSASSVWHRPQPLPLRSRHGCQQHCCSTEQPAAESCTLLWASQAVFAFDGGHHSKRGAGHRKLGRALS